MLTAGVTNFGEAVRNDADAELASCDLHGGALRCGRGRGVGNPTGLRGDTRCGREEIRWKLKLREEGLSKCGETNTLLP